MDSFIEQQNTAERETNGFLLKRPDTLLMYRDRIKCHGKKKTNIKNL